MPPKTVRRTRSSNTSSKSTKKTPTAASAIASSGESALSSSSAGPPACSNASAASSAASSSAPTAEVVAEVAARTTSNAELCAVCCQKIVDGSEDALFCEGSCKQWCHRYCVGVPLRHFVSLAASSSPFICPTCSQSIYEQEISLLKASVELLQEETRTLKAEVMSLKERNHSLQENFPPVSRESITYESAGSGRRGVCGGVRGRGRRGTGRGGRDEGGRSGGTLEDFGGQGSSERLGVMDHGHTYRSSGVRDGHGSGAGRVTKKGVPAKKRLDNAKKIWGTLRSTTTAAIRNVFTRTTSESLANRLTLKRKYKMSADRSVGKWWFVVRGEKCDIDALVGVWDRIAVHTAWRLEDMFSYADDVHSIVSPETHTSAITVTDNVSLSTGVVNNDSVSPVTVRFTDEAIAGRNLLCNSPLHDNSSNILVSSPSQMSSNPATQMESSTGSSGD